MIRPNPPDSVGIVTIKRQLNAYIDQLESEIVELKRPAFTLSAEPPKPKNKAKGALAECVEYALLLQLTQDDGQWFYDRMETVDWHLGKAKIKDWQACMRMWNREGYFPSKRQPTVRHTTEVWQPPSGV